MEVQGGHIVRSTGRKDRHSKVCTAKGPRDRRVRLSAHTAIQFYDVQDRLGYDRPSKAVDWLIKKAKAAIDELDELPAWKPTATITTTTTTTATAASQQQQQQQQQMMIDENDNSICIHRGGAVDTITNKGGTTMVGCDGGRVSETGMHNLHQSQMSQNPNENNNSSFLPPSMDSDSIADTIKSFFPMGASAETAPSSIQFQNYPPDLLSRTSSQSQDLRLSLQSFQDPILLHQHHQTHQNDQVLFSGTTTQLGFDGSCSAGWSDHHHTHNHRPNHNHNHPAEIGRFQRMLSWNASAGADTGNASSGGGFIFNSPPTPTQTQTPPPMTLLQPLFGQNQFLSQRGPLQSSNTPSVRAWIDPSIAASIHHHQQQQQHMSPAFHQSSISSIGFATGGFSGFHIPARIQGEEEHDGISDKPSSASSDSRH